ncbi:MAG: hypothetical protein Q7J84_10495 [Sulfuricaulis sp.]|nr:hypothetical protein [Sulfuricaulis sp.]
MNPLRDYWCYYGFDPREWVFGFQIKPRGLNLCFGPFYVMVRR